MVYFFTAEYTPPTDPNDLLADPPSTQTYEVYMGKDKYENDLLIRYGIELDVWFHVDSLSSAHVYLRMKEGMAMDDIPEELIKDCAALCKANSIAGCKQASSDIVFTRWKNLKKSPGMSEGQVGYHRPQNVRTVRIEKCPDRVKRLSRTKVERNLTPDELAKLQQDHLQQAARQKKKHFQQLAQQKKMQKQRQLEERHARSYDRLFVDHADQMSSNQQRATADTTAAEEYEDDFF
jgi:hypothetical protein